MKLEVYQVGKVPPLTVVECDAWKVSHIDGVPTALEAHKNNKIIAMFLFNNIAGFKEMVGESK